MSLKRIAVGVTGATLCVAAFGGANALGQSPPQPAEPGVVYGGERFGVPAWVTLTASRRYIDSLTLPWAINRKRCSDNKGYFSMLFIESRDTVVRVGADGTFRNTTVDDYRDLGTHFVETQTVKGTVTDARVFGTIEGKVKRTKASGRVVRCTFGPQRWSVVN
jgi:hypothetical protein